MGMENPELYDPKSFEALKNANPVVAAEMLRKERKDAIESVEKELLELDLTEEELAAFFDRIRNKRETQASN